jgi:amino acid transporter
VNPISSLTPAPSSNGNGVKAKRRFGTFVGVFTPNVLTILGLILFLRAGWVVGQAGLPGALLIVAIANGISFLTGLSLAAMATSMDVKAGGNYYIISRSLGLEIGGAIGIPLYLSQAISIAFYIIGFTEALRFLEVFQAYDARLIATAVVLLFGLIAYIGADFALKLQMVILAVLVAALVSFFLGGWGSFIAPTLQPSYSPGVHFWLVFAVFFPAVTGIEVGTSMSGDLRDPGRSIPRGTIASIVITALVYFAVVIWLAVHATPEQLITDNLAMQRIALWPPLILAGVWAATLSSALGSVLAAPRTLQAIANDGVVPTWLTHQLGSATEPRAAVLLSTAVAVAVVWMGDLNFVAAMITMFFLNTYGMSNLAAGIERLVGNPSFRPTFRVPWPVSILGALGCYGAMFLIEPTVTVVAIVVSYGLYFYLKRRALQRTWGDVRGGFWFTVTRFALARLEQQRWHVKNWQPQLLVFTGQPHNREQLVELSEWLTRNQGMASFFQLLVGDVNVLAGHGLRETARRHIRGYIRNRNMTAFAEAEVVDDFLRGAITVAQAHGIGGLEANSVLLGWSREPPGRRMQMQLMRILTALGKSVLFLKHDEERQFGRHRVIDVWWRGRGGNADLMVLLAHIIRQHPTWEGARVRLLRVIEGSQGIAETGEVMRQFIKETHVVAEPVVIARREMGQSVPETIAFWSRESDLVLLGLKFPEEAQMQAYSEQLNALVQPLGSVLLVRNGQRGDLLDVS